jgi:hypothetical protein
MFWGIAVLVMFVLYITANGELPIYISFFSPQPNTSDVTAASAMNAAAASSVPQMPGVPAATGPASSNTVPFSTLPGTAIGG